MSAPSLHIESTDSMIMQVMANIIFACLTVNSALLDVSTSIVVKVDCDFGLSWCSGSDPNQLCVPF